MSKSTQGRQLLEDRVSAKLRGGYYTPRKIADALCTWGIRKPSDCVLEPSCGDGVFLESAGNRLVSLGAKTVDIRKQIRGVEIAENEARKARLRVKRILGGQGNGIVQCSDYFEWFNKNPRMLFDCALGNPPFIRYQNFPEPSRTQAMRLLEFLGLKANKLTNIWVPFVVGAITQLKPGGRLAMVVPAELLQVSYASQLREFLISQFDSIDIFVSNEMLFQNAEQEVVLVLADGKTQKARGDHSCRIDLIEEQDLERMLSHMKAHHRIVQDAKLVHHDREKWLKYFLTSPEISLMRELRSREEIGTLANHATVDVGVVTGKNEFFVLSKDLIKKYQLDKYAIPLVGRSIQLKGANLTKKEWAQLADDGHKVYLFYVEALVNGDISKAAENYVKIGEEGGLNTSYKCSIRDPWYCVPAVWAPDCFLFRQIYDFPRVVKNSLGATSTDTIHRVRCKGQSDLFLRNFYTYLTAASSEIEGRSYGGGVLELEPSEAEKLLMPKELFDGMPLEDIDHLVRDGELVRVLEENSRRILINGLGLSTSECAMLREIWQKMRQRRQARGRSKHKRVPSVGEVFELEP
jgi:adenine-specific DNA methylase